MRNYIKEAIGCKKYYKLNKNKLLKQKRIYRVKLFKENPWKRQYYDLRNRCNNPNNERYHRYGGRGIKSLITKDELKQLWFRDKAYLMDKPSIDRINNDGNYEFNNCRFIEMKENSSKDKLKPIIQFDLNGNFIREWGSIKEASKSLKINQGNISSVCRKKYGYKSASGFIWRFKR